jgi:hypothetical protein
MTKDKRLDLKSLPKHVNNPFVENAIKRVEENTVSKKRFLKGSKGVEQTIINRDGEITGHTAFLQQVEVDEDKFAKLYLSQFSAFFDLTKPAIRVFGYIMTQLIPNKDHVFIVLDDATKYTSYKTKNSVIEGLTRLCEVGILARTTTSFKYFINPLVFFNGNRVTFAKTYVRKRKKKIEEDKLQGKMPFWDETIEQSSDFD